MSRTAAPEGNPQLTGGNLSGTQDDGCAARKIDDRGFDADLARPALEHEIDVGAEILAHVRSGGRRDAAKAIGRRRGDRLAEFLQQLLGDGVRGHSYAYGRL